MLEEAVLRQPGSLEEQHDKARGWKHSLNIYSAIISCAGADRLTCLRCIQWSIGAAAKQPQGKWKSVPSSQLRVQWHQTVCSDLSYLSRWRSSKFQAAWGQGIGSGITAGLRPILPAVYLFLTLEYLFSILSLTPQTSAMAELGQSGGLPLSRYRG